MAEAALSFEEALALAQDLLVRLKDGSISDSQAEHEVSVFAQGAGGARGFLVTYLTCDGEIPDSPCAPVINGLMKSPSVVCELLAKNLVMSSTMAITHARNGNKEGEAGSLKVKRRTTLLIVHMDLPEMASELDDMWQSLSAGTGRYADFLKRWKYDDEQLASAREALAPLRR